MVDMLNLKNNLNKMRAPFKIYADFECIFKKCDNVAASCDSSWIVKESEHVPCGFGYKVVCVEIDLVKMLWCIERMK